MRCFLGLFVSLLRHTAEERTVGNGVMCLTRGVVDICLLSVRMDWRVVGDGEGLVC